MSKSRLFLKKTSLAMRPIDAAFVAYYAQKYNLGRGEAIRKLIQAFVDFDKGFDVRAFAKYATSSFADEEEDRELRDELMRQVKAFVEDREKSQAPTKTTTKK